MLRHALATVLCLSGIVSAQTPAKSAPPTDYQLQMHVRVPLRDGIHLNATLYKPVLDPGPLPVILLFSPYPDDTSHPSGSYFAARGYIYAYVDVRGRGDSEGVFHPLDEARDSYDTVEWFAKQPWSNGKVAMFGGSYAGMDQWQAASLHPPHLVTIAPVASVRPAIDFPMSANIPEAYMLQWLTLTSGHTLYNGVFADGKLWSDAAKRLFTAKAPFKQLDTYSGSPGTDFQLWLSHPEIDSFWKKLQLSREQVAGISLPILAITGAHDGDQPGTLSFYADHITATDPKTLANYYLVIGPWNHPGTREPKQDFGGEHYSPASLLDVLRLHREWYDYTMKTGPKPAFLQKPVAFYVAGSGAECWKYADSLATVSPKSQTLYLDATGGAASIYKSGTLSSTQPTNAPTVSFLSDPNDLAAAEDNSGQPGADIHGDALIFHSGPFAEDTEIDGRIDLRLWLSIDAPDTDVAYELYLVTPDGKTHALDQALVRARYRNSLEHAEPIPLNQPQEYQFPIRNWFAMRAAKGSQLRLIVSSVNTPYLEKSFNSMKTVSDQTGADTRIAHITLLQTKDHPSTLSLPLGDPKAACKASADW